MYIHNNMYVLVLVKLNITCTRYCIYFFIYTGTVHDMYVCTCMNVTHVKLPFHHSSIRTQIRRHFNHRHANAVHFYFSCIRFVGRRNVKGGYNTSASFGNTDTHFKSAPWTNSSATQMRNNTDPSSHVP